MDIGRLKLMKTMTSQGHKQLEFVLDAIADAVFMLVITPEGQWQFAYVNKAFLRVSGSKKEEIESKRVEQILPPKTAENIAQNIGQAIRESKEVVWVESVPFKAGAKTIEIKICPYNDDSDGSKIIGTWRDITALVEEQRDKKGISHRLGERIKELATLQKADLILQADAKSKETIFRELVNILPAGWQYPNITEANILFDGIRYTTGDFSSSVSVLSADFAIPGCGHGIIEVGYTQVMPLEQEGPFLQEERNLIDMLAEKIKVFAERRATAGQLLNEKELSDAIVNNLPGIFYLFDTSGRFLHWNRNFELVSGYTSEEIRQLHPLDFFDEEEKEIIAARIGEVFSGRYKEVEANFRSKNGSKTPYFFNGNSIYYNDQLYLIGSGVDISGRKRMELELREAELKFRTLVERSQVGVYLVQNGRLVYLNERFAEMFGYAIDELTGVSVLETFVAPECRIAAKLYTYSCLSGKDKKIGFELTGVKKDGTKNYIEFFAGRTVFKGQQALIGTVLDITERKAWEESLQRSEANLQSIFKTTDTCYTLVDKDLKLQSFNQRAEQYLVNHIASRPTIGCNFIDLFPSERKRIVKEQIEIALSGKDVIYEISYPRPDGLTTWLLVKMFPIAIEGKILGVIVASSDITEMRHLQQQMIERTVEAQKKMARAILTAQEKERAWIGRELHDNVNQLLVSSKMTLGLTSDIDKTNNDLVCRATQLIDNAINEIRVLTHEELIPAVKNNLYELVGSLLDSIAGFSGLCVDFVYDIESVTLDDELCVNIYRIIQEAFNNIIRHAAASCVSLSVKPVLSGIKIFIRDDGKGFNTTQVSGGVGLSNISNRVESYNGTLSLKSAPGEGCEIEFVFPKTTHPYGKV